MFQFLMGVLLGFVLMWAFRTQPAGTEIRERAEDVARTAQRQASQMASEARATMESFRERSTS